MSLMDVGAVVGAAMGLMRGGHWEDARALLSAAEPSDAGDEVALAVARVELAADQDFWQQTDHWPAALAAVEPLLDGEFCWDVAFAQFRKDYSVVLFSGGEAGDLGERAAELIKCAPDARREAAACFWAGVLADNLLDDSRAAYGQYVAALALAEQYGDELTASYALRHLGDHAHTAGDLVLAREHWERSTELRQKVGHVPGALAQQVLVAGLLRDEGDVAGSRAVAAETNRWARQLGIGFIVRQTADLMA